MVHAWPLELINGMPLDPVKTCHHVAELRDQVAPDLFENFDPHALPRTSLPGFALTAAAYRLSNEVGEAVAFALRAELFELGHDISDPDVLNRIRSTYEIPEVTGDDHQSVFHDWNQGTERGVKGSPHFFCDTRNIFCPLLDIERDEHGHLQMARDAAVLNEFLTACR